MSYEIIKNISVNFKTRKISVTSESNNVSPRTYHTWYPVDLGYDFDEWLRMFAYSCFDGSTKFLPSCAAKAHEAYFRASEEMGIENKWGGPDTGGLVFGSPEYKALFEKWYAFFLDFLKHRSVCKEKYTAYIKNTNEPVTVQARKGKYGAWTARYWYCRKPKPITWLQKKYIELHFDKFGFEPAA